LALHTDEWVIKTITTFWNGMKSRLSDLLPFVLLISIKLVPCLPFLHPRSYFLPPMSKMYNVVRRSSHFRHRTPVRSLFSMSNDEKYDVIVIGGGHAGCEAAHASAATGARTALITQRIDTIGEMSCNPSIGGIGKGHLVKEIDALGGVMGDVADKAGIHFRLLNRRKGSAVRGPRAQADRDIYKKSMQDIIVRKDPSNLDVIEQGVEDLLLEESSKKISPLAPFTNPLSSNHCARVVGVVLSNGDEILSRSVVLTTGTFLRGVCMMGKERYVGGRHLRDSEKVEPPSIGLAKVLERFQFPLSRLKTGTPPRLDGRTIDWEACVVQPSENPGIPFSHLRQFKGEELPNANQFINCYQSRTNSRTHDLVTKYAHTLPEYDALGGKGNGPRYCPSIFKKVERFPDRDSHNCFLEPEGLNTHLVYPNGMSGPYPPDIQLEIMRSMPGLENVDIETPGYDVEYDFVNPLQTLTHTLESKAISGFYLAGQICGTTGYEEAAAQGIVAGANAGRAAGCSARGETPPKPFVIARDEGYIGVLIDDLVTRGTTEPYRMFTSRAEYRISLRADNADLRLTQKAINNGLITDVERILALETRQNIVQEKINELKQFKLFVSEWADTGSQAMKGDTAYSIKAKHQKKSAEQILQMPHVTLRDVEHVIKDHHKTFQPSPSFAYETIEASIKYQNYVHRQEKDMEIWRKAQGLSLPPDIEYSLDIFPTFSAEEIEKLNLFRPSTFSEASSISGITPQSLVYLYHYVNRYKKNRDFARAGKEQHATV